ncbi:dipeptidyl aminopeptidase/acylaminoacyl peptidase [Algoriphagus ratkowskyi]|uniref:Dipeptidyl aminopeptidase/acylaminoacyl peptidase n=2 Tax=Algoriphagus ratkowskyi TaxID=57028 RepID=A0A2W7TCX7_9BACT|nr:dipeptidyl aminopeptidase/acylaminoacyl peptidase [Algoriphagus ratkowskyi]
MHINKPIIRMRLKNITVLSVLLLWSCLLAAQDKKPIQLSDMVKIVTVSDPEFMPDGKNVIFVKSFIETNKEKEYEYKSQVLMMDVANPEIVKVLNSPSYDLSSYSLSPDGKKLAFTKAWEGKSQVWILPLDGGEAQVLTSEKHGASGPTWSPDSKKILFSISMPMWAMEGAPSWTYPRPGREFGDEPNYAAIKDGLSKDSTKTDMDGNVAELRAWLAKNASKNDPTVIDRVNFLGERGLSTDISFRHLGVIDVATKKSEILTSGYQSFGGAAWSPDGTYILASSIKSEEHPDDIQDSDLYKINLSDKAISIFLQKENYRLSSPQFSPDGKLILISGQQTEDRAFNQSLIGTVKTDGSGLKWFTEELDRRVGDAKWSGDSKSVYFSGANEGGIALYRATVSNGKVNTVISGPVGINSFDVLGEKLVYSKTEVSNPSEIYAATIEGKNEKVLTHYNSVWLADRWVSQPIAHRFEQDGFNVDYWVMPPYGLKEGQKYPTLLEMHGGPTAMWGPGESSMWHEFQVLAGRGYGVVYANPRGSGGYGKSFQKGNYQDWGDGPAKDVLTALDKAGEEYSWIDEDQLVLTGGSYAGYLAAWIVGHDNRFKAALAQRGVYELTFFMGEGNAWRLVPNYFGYPWEEGVKEILEYNSPQTYVQNIETPLMIFHGDNDLRTGVRQSELLYKSLKILGKPVEYVRYPNEGHELSRSGAVHRRLDRMGRIVEFFERYVEHPN